MRDEGAELPNGERLAAGERLQTVLLENREMPLAWDVLQSEAEAWGKALLELIEETGLEGITVSALA